MDLLYLFCVLMMIHFKLTITDDLNLALNKTAYQSSTYGHYYAEKAVDGNTDGYIYNAFCAHGNDAGSGPNWLVVDLDDYYQIGRVVVHSRDSIENRLKNFIVGLTNEFDPNTNPPVRGTYAICGQYPERIKTSSAHVVRCHINLPRYRYVIIQQPASGVGCLTICELQVYESQLIEKFRIVGCVSDHYAEESRTPEEVETMNKCVDLCHSQERTYFAFQESKCICLEEYKYPVRCNASVVTLRSICPIGYYGPQCSSMCNCRDGLQCHIATGACPDGCKEGWIGDQCNQSVAKSFILDEALLYYRYDYIYGMNSTECRDICRNFRENFASLYYGYCYCGDVKPQQGWSSYKVKDIVSTCPIGTYEYMCSMECHCRDGEGCHYSTGMCFNKECEQGWAGETCGVKDCSGMDCGHLAECVPGDLQQGTSPRCFCRDGYERVYLWTPCTKIPVKSQTIIIVVVVIILIIIIITIGVCLLLFFIWKKKRMTQRKVVEPYSPSIRYSRQQSSDKIFSISNHLKAGPPPPSQPPSSIYETICHPPTMEAKLKIEDFPNYVAGNSQKFVSEFESLNAEPNMSCAYAMQKQLKMKNRFKNILPYDNNRVILKQLPGHELSDYINASYITGCRCPIVIATQAPTNNTVHDFWRMIGEQGVRLIVMLCDLRENNKVKCHKYWPDEGQDVSYGGHKIICKSVVTWSNFHQREFVVETPQSSKLHLTQLHFTTWPDHGVPDDLLFFLSFRKRYRTILNDKQCVSVVHCSAGIGRTGCFLAIDTLLERSQMDECLDVQACVLKLREERAQMVQIKMQYEFIYNCLVGQQIMGDTTFTPDEFINIFIDKIDSDVINGKLTNQFEFVHDKEFVNLYKISKKRKKQRDIYNQRMIHNPLGYLSFCLIECIDEDEFLECLPQSCDVIVLFDRPDHRPPFIPTREYPIASKTSKYHLENAKNTAYGVLYVVKRVKLVVGGGGGGDSGGGSDVGGIYENLENLKVSDDEPYQNLTTPTTTHVITILHVVDDIDDVASVSEFHRIISKYHYHNHNNNNNINTNNILNNNNNDNNNNNNKDGYYTMPIKNEIIINSNIKSTSNEKNIYIYNRSDTEIMGRYLTFANVLDTITNRNWVTLYDHVVALNEQAGKVVVKNFATYKDLHKQTLEYLVKARETKRFSRTH